MNLQKYYDVLEIKDPNNMSEIETQRWTKLMNLSPTARGYICKAKEQGYDVIDCYSKEELFKRYNMQFKFESLVEYLKLKPIKIKRGENLYVQYLDSDNLKKLDEFMSQPRDIIKRITRETTCLKKYGFKSHNQSPKMRQQIAESVKKTWTDEHRKQVSESVKKSWDNKSLEERERIRKHIKEGSIRGKEKVKQTIERYRQQLQQDGNEYLYITDVTDYLEISWDKLRERRNQIENYPDYIQKGNCKFFKKTDVEELYKVLKTFRSRSFTESDFAIFIKSIYKGPVKLNDRTVLQGRELDVYLPDLQLAFEYNGLYWHSDIALLNIGEIPDQETRKIFQLKHINKTNLCKEKGIRLIHIFEDDWLQRRSILESIVKISLGVVENKIFARRCRIQEISLQDYRNFLQINHLQGYSYANIRFGLYYKDHLVMVLGLNTNGVHSSEPELVRLCTKLNTRIVGGFSKLLKHLPNFSSICSYIDIGTFSGYGYEKLGFKIIKQNGPTYFYTQGSQREPRYRYMRKNIEKLYNKKILKYWNPQETEEINMYKNGFGRIWNCGTYKVRYQRDR